MAESCAELLTALEDLIIVTAHGADLLLLAWQPDGSEARVLPLGLAHFLRLLGWHKVGLLDVRLSANIKVCFIL